MPEQDWDDQQRRVALAAALMHDLGHGMFSHAFEEVGREVRRKHGIDLPLTEHEEVTSLIIQHTDIATVLEDLGTGFASSVATVIRRKRPESLYDAVVSSQFDADRLDYMRRDRAMTGVQSGGIDFTWLLDNLEIGEVVRGTDEVGDEPLKTFVLGRKAIMAGEQYVLALFQLYPTLYFHKATVAAEVLFAALLTRIFTLVNDNQVAQTGLPRAHAMIRFVRKPRDVDAALALDDTVFWGALPMLADAKDHVVSRLATALRDRKLPKAIDLQPNLEMAFPQRQGKSGLRMQKARDRVIQRTKILLEEWSDKHSIDADKPPRIMVRAGKRDPYSLKEEKGPLNRIRVNADHGRTTDIADHSPMVAALRPFEFFRAYVFEGDDEARDTTVKIFKDCIRDEKRERTDVFG